MVRRSLTEGSPKPIISSIRSCTASSNYSGVLVAMTTITLSEGDPVRYRNELIVCLICSDMSELFLFLKKASASSMNRMIPFYCPSAQSKSLLSSLTASGPRGAISLPTITAYSRPDCRASFLANRVLPVPGGP